MSFPEEIYPGEQHQAVIAALEHLLSESKKYAGARAVIQKLNAEKKVLNQRIQELADEVVRLRILVQSLEAELELQKEIAAEQAEYNDRCID